tara:strand:- start:411 stop:644 length:234 start_codon:yes stop_codon:yes gene_type:complete
MYRVRYNDGYKYKYSKELTSFTIVKGIVIGNVGEGEHCIETIIFPKKLKPQVQKEICVDSFYGTFKWINVKSNKEDK